MKYWRPLKREKQMRATEALWLSNPNTELNAENRQLCTHLDIERNIEEIKQSRRENRKLPGLFR